MNTEKNISKNYLPLQRCIKGEEIRNLSDPDLLALILGTGTKNQDVIQLSSGILKSSGGLQGLRDSGLRELSVHVGIGLKKAVRISAALELGRRAFTISENLNRVDSPEAVWRLLLPEIAGFQREKFMVLVVNNKNMVLKKSLISIGTVSESIVHPREVFRDAIREGGSAIIISHNHPSGILTPSREDIITTERLVEAGRIIGIPLLDHIIVSGRSYYSMKESGEIK
jgi:DNA repair protein RadC